MNIPVSAHLLLAFALLASACDDTPAPDPYDRTAMLRSLVDVVVLPSYEDFAAEAATLEAHTEAFCAAPDEAGLLGARGSWRSARSAYLRTEAMAIGPAMTERLEGEIDFRPTRPANIETAVAASEEASDAWLDGQGVSVKGLPAMEYLLYPVGLDDAAATATFVEGDVANRRCAVLAAMARAVRRAADRLVSAWSPSGDDYRGALVGAGEGSTVYPTRHHAVSELVNRQLSVLEDIKLNRLGNPLGALETGPDPAAVETPYTDHAVAGMLATLRGVRAIWLGDYGGVEGIGLDDYVRSRDPELADRYTRELDDTIGLFESVFPPLAQRIEESDTSDADAAYEGLRRTERTWATDIEMTLAVTVTFTDNDGD